MSICIKVLHVLLQDMTSRELLQQRTTEDNGDTTWRVSPLVEAALKGRLAVLDGIHRVDIGTLAVLKRWSYPAHTQQASHAYSHTCLTFSTHFSLCQERSEARTC